MSIVQFPMLTLQWRRNLNLHSLLSYWKLPWFIVLKWHCNVWAMLIFLWPNILRKAHFWLLRLYPLLFHLQNLLRFSKYWMFHLRYNRTISLLIRKYSRNKSRIMPIYLQLDFWILHNIWVWWYSLRL